MYPVLKNWLTKPALTQTRLVLQNVNNGLKSLFSVPRKLYNSRKLANNSGVAHVDRI